MTGPDAHEVLVVGWYPAGDDSFAGRFIADQVAALGATGRVRPTVATFENVVLGGDDQMRSRQEAAIEANVFDAVHAGSAGLTTEGAFGARDVPVARLGVAAGPVSDLGPAHQEIHRRRSLLALVDARARRWDLVHGHVGYPEGAAASAAAAALDVPFILTEHATYLATFFADPVLRQRYLATARAARRILPVSRALGRELITEFPELEPKIVPVPNTVAIDDFRVVPVAARRTDELLWVGYRKRAKGIDTLLEAFQRVHASRPTLRLRLVGRSSTVDEERGWHDMATRLGLSDVVTFDGPADRAGVAAAMERATLFIHPSPRETFGVVAVEALSTGLPVVACDSGGVTEVLGDEPTALGSVVPAGDPEALAAAILTTLDRRTGFDPKAMRAYVEARFGTRAVADRIVDVYDDVLREASEERAGAGPDRGAIGESSTGSSRTAAATDGPATTTSRSGDGGAESPERRPPRYIVVGFQRTVLDRYLLAVPAWALEGVEIVTTGDGRLPSPPIGSGSPDDTTLDEHHVGLEPPRPTRRTLAEPGTDRRVVELVRWGLPPTGPQSARRRIRRAAVWPLRWIRRVRRRAWLEDAVLGELERTLARALAAADRDDAGRPIVLVCVAGLDHLVARSFGLRGEATVAQGGFRWLADQRWRQTSVQAHPSTTVSIGTMISEGDDSVP